jgi:hypothetical protein
MGIEHTSSAVIPDWDDKLIILLEDKSFRWKELFAIIRLPQLARAPQSILENFPRNVFAHFADFI